MTPAPTSPRIRLAGLVVFSVVAAGCAGPPREPERTADRAPESGERPGDAAASEVEEAQQPQDGAEPEEESIWDLLEDPDDGCFDVSRAIAKGQGLIPIAIPVTEPAVGYGGAGGLVYIHPRTEEEREKRIPPSMSFVGGAGTENGTWGAGAGHFGVFDEGRIRYLGMAAYGDANLTFYGLADELSGGVDWRAQGAVTRHDLKFQVAEGWFVGGDYQFVAIENSFGVTQTGLDPTQLRSENAGLALHVSYDDRDTIFTPSSGTYAKLAGRWSGEIFGGDFDYPGLDLDALHYVDLDPVVLGGRISARFTGQDAPFYARPFLNQRGVPAFRYLGDHTVTAEVEPRWRFARRWSLVGFFALGKAVTRVGDLEFDNLVPSGGGGFRYLLAKDYGLAMGLDVGVSEDDTAIYVVFGSAWQNL